jgi:antibiotic biosynthesis monooxygenase (ABM) superfamily enzyme
VADSITGTYGVVHRVSSGGAIGEYRAGNGTIAITMQSADNSEVVREWLTEDQARAHIERLAAILKTDVVEQSEESLVRSSWLNDQENQ